MKKLPYVLFLGVMLFLILFLGATIFSGCEKVQKEIKHQKSDIIGLKRIVVLYANNGSVIKTWNGRFKVEMNGSVASFINGDGHEIKVSGTYIIEEID